MLGSSVLGLLQIRIRKILNILIHFFTFLFESPISASISVGSPVSRSGATSVAAEADSQSDGRVVLAMMSPPQTPRSDWSGHAVPTPTPEPPNAWPMKSHPSNLADSIHRADFEDIGLFDTSSNTLAY